MYVHTPISSSASPMASPFILLLLLLLGSCEKSQQRPVYSYSGWTNGPAPLAASAHLRGLGQRTGPGAITFNTKTCRRLGFLHYVDLDLGTPKKEIWGLVDTGSSQIWVPGKAHSSPYFCIQPLNTFIPAESSTCSIVPWSKEMCQSAEDDVCRYIINYGSGVSSSGYLVEDVLRLPPRSGGLEVSIKVSFPFGREQKRTGKTKAPNGVAGLGPVDHSLAYALARAGLIAHDSFSICFGLPFEPSKLAFGDVGGSSQKTTPFQDTMKSSLHYEVRVSRISVGREDFDVEFSAAVDTGSEFTILPEDVYNKFTRSYDSMMPTDTRVDTNGEKMPSEYCYWKVRTQVVTLTMDGGDEFPVRPLLPFSSSRKKGLMYCLGVRPSNKNGPSIIGLSFLHGLKIVFDRQRWVLGWEECKDAKGLT